MTALPDLPLLVRLAFLWNRIGPRGRGFVPRHVGRLFGPDADYIIRTAHGARLRMDMSNLEVYAPIYNAQGRWEPHVAATCARMLKPGEVFFDIGANAGMVTLETRAMLGKDVAIYSFEPQPSLARSLRRSLELNSFGNVTVVECLLGDTEGSGELFLTSHAIHASTIPRESHYRKITLPVHTIDTLVSAGTCKPPQVVKIDTEGSEMKILHGMERTLRSSTPSLVFEADENMKRFGYSGDDLVAYLRTLHDYEMYSILPAKTQLTPWRPGVASDVLAVAASHRDRIAADWISGR
jgi:FkbM family methyltransferase